MLNAGDSRFVSNITSVYRVTAGSSFSSACPLAGRHQEELHVLDLVGSPHGQLEAQFARGE